VVLVDDGTTNEQSLHIIDQALEQYPRLIIHRHETNKGLPAARNSGIRACSGEYVFFLDGDDIIDPTCIEKHYLTIKNNPDLDFVNSFVVGFGAQSYKWRGGFHDKERFLHENRNTSCFMARTTLFNKITFDESLRTGCEDWDFWLKAASQGLWGHTIPEYLFYYRRSDNGDKWAVMKSKETLKNFSIQLRNKYEHILKEKGFPDKKLTGYQFAQPDLEDHLPVSIAKPKSGGPGHILFIFPWLEIGGADKFNLDLLKGLKKMGWEMTIACTLKSSHPWYDEFQKLTKDIFLLSNYSHQYEYYRLVSHLIASRNIDQVFISNSLYGYYVTPFIKHQFPAVSIVDCIHCEDLSWMNGGYPRISTEYNNYLDKTIVSTAHLKNFMLGLRADQKGCPIEVCYTNIDSFLIKRDDTRRAEKRKKLGIPDDCALILFSARLVENKRPLVLAKTIKNLVSKADNFQCVVLGDGPLLPTLREFIAENNLQDKIRCQGSVRHDIHLNYMDAADIFFLPSSNEGIAITCYESMAKELVVVSTAVGGQGELVTPDCGFLVAKSTEKQEIDEYTSILLKLIKNPEVAQQMKIAARTRIETQFDLTHMHERVHNLLVDALNQFHASVSVTAEDYLFMLNQFLNEELKSSMLWNDIQYFKQQNIKNDQVDLAFYNSSILNDLDWFKQEHQRLKEWYGHEYDVLPSWYKRIGHIIKVFKGVRSLKSLFSDKWKQKSFQ
jgi:glycosyltransferase involved in cell wall biosynthesis